MTNVTIKIQGQFPWMVQQPSPNRRWIAECRPLNLAMEAETLDQLYSVINEAVSLLFYDLYLDGELEDFLRQRGWKVSGLPPAGTPDVDFVLRPIELIVSDPEQRAH